MKRIVVFLFKKSQRKKSTQMQNLYHLPQGDEDTWIWNVVTMSCVMGEWILSSWKGVKPLCFPPDLTRVSLFYFFFKSRCRQILVQMGVTQEIIKSLALLSCKMQKCVKDWWTSRSRMRSQMASFQVKILSGFSKQTLFFAGICALDCWPADLYQK